MNRRLELRAFGQPLVLTETPIPEAPAKGAVIKLHFSGICHTDLEVCRGYLDMGKGDDSDQTLRNYLTLPMVPGHELAGEVFSLGADVANACRFNKGDHVMLYVMGGCGDCPGCRLGDNHLCDQQCLLGHGTDGGYQEYVAIPSLVYLHEVPDSLPLDTAALLPCSGITSYSGIQAVKPRLDNMVMAKGPADLLIVGVGGIGLWAVSFAKAVFPQGVTVIAADTTEAKLEAAKSMGADNTVLWNPKDTEGNIQKVREVCPRGLQGCVDFVGSTSTAQSVIPLMAMGSVYAVVGLFGGLFDVPLATLPMNAISVIGVRNGPPRYLKEMADLYCAGKVKHPPVSHVTLEEAPRILDGLKNGTFVGRAVISHPGCHKT